MTSLLLQHCTEGESLCKANSTEWRSKGGGSDGLPWKEGKRLWVFWPAVQGQFCSLQCKRKGRGGWQRGRNRWIENLDWLTVLAVAITNDQLNVITLGVTVNSPFPDLHPAWPTFAGHVYYNLCTLQLILSPEVMCIHSMSAALTGRPGPIVPKYYLIFHSEFHKLLPYYSLRVDPLFHKFLTKTNTPEIYVTQKSIEDLKL